MSEKPKTDSSKYKYIGTRPVRPDGLDKVTGRANYGADFSLPGMLYGKVLRSPYAHAHIKSIDFTEALALDGVFATVCRDDFPVIPKDFTVEGIILSVDAEAFSRQVIARDKALYYGHAIAALAATSEEVAAKALELIKIDYEILPHAMTIDEALAEDAPVIEEGLVTKGSERQIKNVSLSDILERGDVEKGFSRADLVIERTYEVPSTHQAYIEPHSCVVEVNEEGKAAIWCSTQGAFAVRAYTSYIVGMDLADITVTPAEIGGGFGGKLFAYLEPLATVLSCKTGKPVKMTMNREEVFCGTGYAPAARVRVKAGTLKSGKLVAFDAHLEYEGGAFTGGSMAEGRANMVSAYNVPNMRVSGTEVLVNKPNVMPYRAPGSPQAVLASENVIDELAEGLGIDPIDFRLMNVNKEGDTTLPGIILGPVGFEQCLKQAKAHPHYQAELSAGHGRGVAFAFYMGGGCRSSAILHVKENGKMVLSVGTTDIGGSRASMALMAAETLGVPSTSIVPQVLGTEMVGFSDVTGGSRVTFATGMAVVKAAEQVKQELCRRAAMQWNVEPELVCWKDGAAHLETEKEEVLSIQELARNAYKTGDAISASVSYNAPMQGASCAVNIADACVDQETGEVNITRFTAIQDVGTAIHPDYVEGQMQGGAMQGIGWALTEEYIYDEDGRVLNAGFLDYRMPVASDLPMLDTQIVEVPDPNHPYGVRGAGETPICAPMAATSIAVNHALRTRITQLPLNPSRVMQSILDRETD